MSPRTAPADVEALSHVMKGSRANRLFRDELLDLRVSGCGYPERFLLYQVGHVLAVLLSICATADRASDESINRGDHHALVGRPVRPRHAGLSASNNVVSSRRSPEGNVCRAVGTEGSAVPTTPACLELEPGQRTHQI